MGDPTEFVPLSVKRSLDPVDAVSVLGGPQFLTLLRDAGMQAIKEGSAEWHPGRSSVTDCFRGEMKAYGVAFDFLYSPNSRPLEPLQIYGAEVVEQHPAQPEALTEFFRQLWTKRARTALEVTSALRP